MAYGQGQTYDIYSQDPEFQRLQTAFTGAFGSSFPTFSYEEFSKNPQYQEWIYNQITGDKAGIKQAALNDILGYFDESTFNKAGGEIDVQGIFGPLKDELKNLTEMQIQRGVADVSRGQARATELGQESLAGTGLGRSGASAQMFSDIARRGEEKKADIALAAREREAQARLAIDTKISDLQFQEKLQERGMNANDILSATNFRRQMQLLYTQTMMEMAANEPSFWEEWGPVFEIAGGAAAFAFGQPALGTALVKGGVS